MDTFKSKFTGKQIDRAIEKASDISGRYYLHQLWVNIGAEDKYFRGCLKMLLPMATPLTSSADVYRGLSQIISANGVIRNRGAVVTHVVIDSVTKGSGNNAIVNFVGFETPFDGYDVNKLVYNISIDWVDAAYTEVVDNVSTMTGMII